MYIHWMFIYMVYNLQKTFDTPVYRHFIYVVGHYIYKADSNRILMSINGSKYVAAASSWVV